MRPSASAPASVAKPNTRLSPATPEPSESASAASNDHRNFPRSHGYRPGRGAFDTTRERSPMTRLRSHLSYANIVASLALFLALGGTSYAVVSLPRNSV